MSELTKQWKEGKLKLGAYYVVYQHNKRIWLYRDRKQTPDNSPDIFQILDSVPNYDKYKAMQAELAEHRHYCCCAENEVMRLKLAGLEDQIANASKKVEELEDEIAELKEENKQLEEDTGYGWHTAGIESDKNDKLRALLKGCKLSTFKIYDRLRFSDENEITPADLINAVDEIKPMLWGILNSINAALGESEER